MKQIFEGTVFEILPSSRSIIFSYCKEAIENEITVAYKMISFDNGRISDITKNVYLAAKYGNNYHGIINHCEHYITDKSIILPNGKILLFSKSAVTKLIDTDSSVIWQGKLSYRNFNASDIIIYKNSLWACFSDCNVLLRYNLSTMREELRIGGNKSPFQSPKSMFLENEIAIVCNAGSGVLSNVNLEDYTVTENCSFNEEVLQYVKADIYRFIILKSGLYMM